MRSAYVGLHCASVRRVCQAVRGPKLDEAGPTFGMLGTGVDSSTEPALTMNEQISPRRYSAWLLAIRDIPRRKNLPGRFLA